MIQTLAAKIATPIIAGILLVSTVVLGTATVVQSIRLNGFGVLGWDIAEGYRPLSERLANENIKLVTNNLTLGSMVDKCSAGVASLEKARQTFAKAAQSYVDERLRLQQDYARRAGRVSAIKPTDASCPSVDNIFNTGFGK